MYDPNENAEVPDTNLENFQKFGEYSSENQRQKFENQWIDRLFTCEVQKSLFLELFEGKDVSFKVMPEISDGRFTVQVIPKKGMKHHFIRCPEGQLASSMGSYAAETILLLAETEFNLPKDLYTLFIKTYLDSDTKSLPSVGTQFINTVSEEFDGILIKNPPAFCFGKHSCLFEYDNSTFKYFEKIDSVGVNFYGDVIFYVDDVSNTICSFHVNNGFFFSNGKLTDFAKLFFGIDKNEKESTEHLIEFCDGYTSLNFTLFY